MPRFATGVDLVFDLGMHDGEDTDYYLKKGLRVVAVEANPRRCEEGRVRHGEAIAAGRLVIENAALWSGYATRPFYVNTVNDHWSSLDEGWAGREGNPYQAVTIACVPVTDLFGRHGVPLYMKIDIEGADELVVRQLVGLEVLPAYLSIEDCRFGYEYLERLREAGYDGFKLLDQSTVGTIVDPEVDHRFKLGSSGPFGELVPGEWRSYAEMVEEYRRRVRDQDLRRIAPPSTWWDIHCRGAGVRPV
jgi:FkbM family methyltransferase